MVTFCVSPNYFHLFYFAFKHLHTHTQIISLNVCFATNLRWMTGHMTAGRCTGRWPPLSLVCGQPWWVPHVSRADVPHIARAADWCQGRRPLRGKQRRTRQAGWRLACCVFCCHLNTSIQCDNTCVQLCWQNQVVDVCTLGVYNASDSWEQQNN
jgi:hypothetical protein